MSIVVTGIGVISPLGATPAWLFQALCEGRSAITDITSFDASPFPIRQGGLVQGFQGKNYIENRKNLKLMTPSVQFGLAALKLAAGEAGLSAQVVAPSRLGMFVGAGTAFGDLAELIPALAKASDGGDFDPVRFARDGMPLVNPLWLLKGLSNNVLGYGSAQLDAQGINQNYCNSSVGAMQALGEAAYALLEDRADIILAGGHDSAVNPEHLAGFGPLGVLSSSGTPRPFDRRHDGFVLGEGGAFFVLEREAFARARGARVLARLCGFGNATSLRGMSGVDPDSIVASFRGALQSAKWAPAEVDCVFAHGNANPKYDDTEALVLRRVFGDRQPMVTADKGALGHAITAAGVLSCVSAVTALSAGRVPHIKGLETPAEACAGLDLVIGQPREGKVARILVHAGGLGGQTSTLAWEATS